MARNSQIATNIFKNIKWFSRISKVVKNGPKRTYGNAGAEDCGTQFTSPTQ